MDFVLTTPIVIPSTKFITINLLCSPPLYFPPVLYIFFILSTPSCKTTLLFYTILRSTLLYSTLLYSTLLYSTLLLSYPPHYSFNLHSSTLLSSIFYSTLYLFYILFSFSFLIFEKDRETETGKTKETGEIGHDRELLSNSPSFSSFLYPLDVIF